MDNNKYEKWYRIIGGALIVVFLFQIIKLNGKLENMEQTINNLQSSIYNVDSNISNLENTIVEQENFVAGIYNQVNPNDISKDGYLLNSSVSFKELIEGEEPYIVYRAIRNNLKEPTSYSEWTTVKLEKTAPLSYEVSLALNYNNDYEYKFVTQGAQERSSSISSLSRQEYAPIRMEISEHFSEQGGKNAATGLFINVYNQYNVEGFEVDKITAKVIGTDKEYVATKVKQEEIDGKYNGKLGMVSERYKIEVTAEELSNKKSGYFPISIELVCKNGFKIVDDTQGLSY